MRTLRLPLLIVAGCLVPLIAHVALAQGDPAAPVPPAPPAGSTAVPGAPTAADTAPAAPGGTATTAPSGSSTAPAATDTTAPPPPTDTAPVTPPPPPAPTETAPVTTPTVTAPSAPPPTMAPAPMAPPAPAEADKAEKKKRPGRTLAIEGDIGAGVRIGSLSSGYQSASRSGLLYGGGLYFAPDRQWTVGLSYAYSLASRENLNPTSNDVVGNIDRRLQTLALNLRAYPLRNESIGLYAGLMVGAAWQTASASGSTLQDTFPASPTKTYQANGGPNAGLALGASVGMDVDLSNEVALLTSANFTHYRLTSDPLSGSAEPIPGIGSTSQIDFRVAFQYRFDLSGQSSPVNVTTGSR